MVILLSADFSIPAETYEAGKDRRAAGKETSATSPGRCSGRGCWCGRRARVHLHRESYRHHPGGAAGWPGRFQRDARGQLVQPVVQDVLLRSRCRDGKCAPTLNNRPFRRPGSSPQPQRLRRPGHPSSRRSRRSWISTAVALVVLGVLLFPVYWMVNASLQIQAVTAANTTWFPFHFSLDSYRLAFQQRAKKRADQRHRGHWGDHVVHFHRDASRDTPSLDSGCGEREP